MRMVFEMFLLMVYFNVFSPTNACGQLPTGQERTISFTVSDFKLPAVMVYSEEPGDKIKVSTISTSMNEAVAFVQRLIKEAVEDVLYQQGRSAFLSDNVISLLLQQLDVKISYEPLKCDNVITKPLQANNGFAMMKKNCIIVDGLVTSTCTHANMGCKHDMITPNLKLIEAKYFSIAGSLKTSNAVMANWSNQMWQSVLVRVLRSITSGPNASYFAGASVKLN